MSVANRSYILNTFSQTRSRYLFIFLFFLVWPFGAFLYALYYYDKEESKVVMILFTALLGCSMIGQGMDLGRILGKLPAFYRLSYSDFFGRVTHLFSNPDSDSPDLYRDLVTFIVSRFTDNGRWLMFVFGLIAGYVYTKVLSIFIAESPEKNIYTYILIISFSFIIGIDQVSGVRFCLAAYVFFYGAVNLIIHEEKRYLIIAAISILIHFSFLSPVLLLFGFLKLKNYPKIIYSLLILSFILPNLLHSYIVQYSSLLGGAIENRTELYNNLVEDINYGNDTVWYVRFRIILMTFFCYLTLFFTQIKKKELNYSVKLNDLFFFSLIILSFVNFTFDIPHLGYRFQFVFFMFAFFYLFKVYIQNTESRLISNLVLMVLPFSLLLIIYSLRITLELTPLTSYYFNMPGIVIYKPVQSAWFEMF